VTTSHTRQIRVLGRAPRGADHESGATECAEVGQERRRFARREFLPIRFTSHRSKGVEPERGVRLMFENSTVCHL